MAGKETPDEAHDRMAAEEDWAEYLRELDKANAGPAHDAACKCVVCKMAEAEIRAGQAVCW